MNHLISDHIPASAAGSANSGGYTISNSDPITGQAGWYNVRVRIYKAEAGEPEETWPQFEPVPAAPGTNPVRRLWQAFVAGTGEWK